MNEGANRIKDLEPMIVRINGASFASVDFEKDACVDVLMQNEKRCPAEMKLLTL